MNRCCSRRKARRFLGRRFQLLIVATSITWGSITWCQDPPKPALDPMELVERFAAIEWRSGPTRESIGAMATIRIPEGYALTGRAGASDLLELYGNPPNAGLLAAIIPESPDEDWTLVFQFADIGYVDDSDRGNLNADALMRSIRERIADGRRNRRRPDADRRVSIRWQQPPRYDLTSHRLTWALNLDLSSGSSINHETRLLGRHGVMEATLICDPASYADAVPQVRRLLGGFTFVDGKRYGQWRPGDPATAFGLVGLIAGPNAANRDIRLLEKWSLLTTKDGKTIVIGVVLVFAVIGSIVKRLVNGPIAATDHRVATDASVES